MQARTLQVSRCLISFFNLTRNITQRKANWIGQLLCGKKCNTPLLEELKTRETERSRLILLDSLKNIERRLRLRMMFYNIAKPIQRQNNAWWCYWWIVLRFDDSLDVYKKGCLRTFLKKMDVNSSQLKNKTINKLVCFLSDCEL